MPKYCMKRRVKDDDTAVTRETPFGSPVYRNAISPPIVKEV